MELEIEGKKEYSLSSVDLPHCLDCSTLSEAARVIHCNICDCWHSSLYLIIFPMYTCPLLAKDKAGGKMLLCWFLIITFLVSIFTAFSFTHTLHGVASVSDVLFSYLLNSMLTPLCFHMCMIYKCEYLTTASEKQVTQP